MYNATSLCFFLPDPRGLTMSNASWYKTKKTTDNYYIYIVYIFSLNFLPFLIIWSTWEFCGVCPLALSYSSLTDPLFRNAFRFIYWFVLKIALSQMHHILGTLAQGPHNWNVFLKKDFWLKISLIIYLKCHTTVPEGTRVESNRESL